MLKSGITEGTQEINKTFTGRYECGAHFSNVIFYMQLCDKVAAGTFATLSHPFIAV